MAADKKTLLRDALKQVQGGKLDKAIETYKAIVKVDPRDASVRNSLGDLYIKQNKKKEAIAEYLEASALFEKDGFALRSIAICQKIVNLDPEQWAVRLKLGDLYALQKLPAEARGIYLQVADRHDKRGEVSAALEVFRKIANLEPENLPVRVKLAGMFEKQKKPVEAAEEYVRAAKGYVDRKEPETAVQLYVRAFKLAPANLEARRRLAEFYAQRQDWAVVVGLLETPVAKGSRDAELLVQYAEALTRVNHPADAVKVLEKAQEREPNSVPVNLALGRAHLKGGDIGRGTEALNRCVSVHLAENRLESAEALLREMAEAAPDDEKVAQRILEVAQKRGVPAAVGAAYLRIAAVHERKGLVRSAVGALEKYLEVVPGDQKAAARLAELKAKSPAPMVEAPAVPAATPAVAPAAPAPPPAPAASAPPSPAAAPPAPQAPVAPRPDEPAEEELLDINLDELAGAGVAEGEEIDIEVEVEGEEPAAAAAVDAEPASVADALAAVRRGAPERAAAFLEDHLGANPADVGAWEALVEARRSLGSQTGVRDALLRLADLHRRASRFEEAHQAFKGALDIDPRNVIAARGLTALLEQEAAAGGAPEVVAPPPAAPKAEEPEVFELPEEEEIPEVLELVEEGEVPESFDLPEEAAAAAVLEIPEEEIAAVPEIPEAEGEAGLEEFDLEVEGALPPAAAPASAEPRPELESEPPLVPEPPPIPAFEAETEFVLEPGLEGAIDLTPTPTPTPAPEAVPELVAPAAAAPPPPAPVLPPPPLEAPAAAVAPVDTAAPQFWGMEELLEEPPAPEPPPPPAPQAAPFEEFEEVSLEGSFAGLDLEEAPVPPPEPPPAAAPQAERIAIPESGTGTGEFDEFLAEANFYLQQGLLDEAEFLYQKLSRLSPGNAEIAGQLRKLEEMRGPVPAPEPPRAPQPEPPPVAAAPPPPVPGDAAPDLAGLDADLELAFAAGGLPPELQPEAGPAVDAVDVGAGDFSEFLSGLRTELESQVEEAPPPPPQDQNEEGLTEIFQEFQRSVKEQLGDEDYETHYNLGIAYKEMGLMEEAIGEFSLSEKSPVRRMDSVSMIALCLREMGRFDESAQKLRTGISLAVEGSEDQKGFLYDLAGLHEQAGRATEARETLLRLQAVDPGYRDVSARVGAPPPPAPGQRKKPKVSYL